MSTTAIIREHFSLPCAGTQTTLALTNKGIQRASWAKANSISISAVHTDSSLFGGNQEWHDTWSKKGLTQGYMAPVSALQIDAGRVTSTKYKNSWLATETK